MDADAKIRTLITIAAVITAIWGYTVVIHPF